MEKNNRKGAFKVMIDKLLMPKAYVEVLEILKYIPIEDYNKIPNEIIENMQLNIDKEYKYTITHFDNFQEQEMLKETETILAVLFRDYWATEEERNKILEKEKYDLDVLEKEKRKIYNPDNIFKNKIENNHSQTEIKENSNMLIEYKTSFFTKLKDFIIKILHINS